MGLTSQPRPARSLPPKNPEAVAMLLFVWKSVIVITVGTQPTAGSSNE